ALFQPRPASGMLGPPPEGAPVPRIRPLATAMAIAALAVSTSGGPVRAQELPDIGSSAGELLSPVQQEQYGQMLLGQLRHYGYTLEDPLLEGWLQQAGA